MVGDREDENVAARAADREGPGRGHRRLVAVALAALVVAGLAATGLRAVAPYADAYHRRPLLLVGPFDAAAAQVALWALLWLAGTVVASAAVPAVRRGVRGRLRVLVVAVPALAAVGTGIAAAGCLVLLVLQWTVTPTYTRLPVTDTEGRHWVVAEHSNGFAPATSWRVYRGGPWAYDEVPALRREVEGRVTPVADGQYSVRTGPDGAPVLRFTASGQHEIPLR